MDYHPNLDGPAEPIGLAMAIDHKAFMRKIYCEECGKPRLAHPEDAALGIVPRRTHGKLVRDVVCDGCGEDVTKGASAVAESVPSDMVMWEDYHLTLE